jgi:hypothetical protein
MPQHTYEKEISGLVLIDPYNDVIAGEKRPQFRRFCGREFGSRANLGLPSPNPVDWYR